MSEEKIFIKPDETIEEVIDHITSSRAEKVILNIPQDSALTSSVDNFHRLKRESAMADKKLVIESVDSKVEEMANLSDIDSVNPIFGKKENLFADIIPRGKARKKKRSSGDVEKENFLQKSSQKPSSKNKNKSKGSSWSLKLPSPKIGFSKRLGSLLAVLAFLGGGFYIATAILPKATVALNLETKNKTFTEEMTISQNATSSSIRGEKIVIPGEFITATKNLEKSFSASSNIVQKEVEKKAQGKLEVYNNYGTTSVPLVENTRFKSPEGKVYNLVEPVTVPPAKQGEDGLIPSSIEVTVTASEPGESYNTDKISDKEWTIPGFKDSGLIEMYRGFYAKPATLMKGGFVGKTAQPQKQDLDKSRKDIKQTLRQSLRNQIKVLHSSDLKILDEAEQFQVLNENIKKKEKGNGFRIFMEGQLKKVGFQEDKLRQLLAEKLFSADYPFEITDSEIRYKVLSVSWASGKVKIETKGFLEVKPKIDKEKLKAEVLGKSKELMKPAIFETPGLKSGEVSLWPFWVREVPENPERVEIKTN